MAVAGEIHTSCCAKGIDRGGGVFFKDTWSECPPCRLPKQKCALKWRWAWEAQRTPRQP